ncbi:pyridoxamine 5'-phosphate oxidase family protein [Heyndrickxia acidicola]|uniref:Pyridoxamine 5'-phosphate oxidase family protein n=1 Tax=Heyndrickxia acidicola TaxID=209389 RepID=A0ABU6MH79_9BACI|nr:pyridoxamine 5'-phosphate oxidase family protein [Heyndrickxia acidicola]MED1203008.1 pyridoxamine 5'-phosphate oxidase family protein [Heyndrickxia acidicola]
MEARKVFKNVIETEEELRALLGFPSELVKNKVISSLDGHCRDFISKSPFLVLSTSDSDGQCDASPRGDSPGFVLVLDDKWLVIPERRGNKKMDSLRNVVTNPHVGLLFLIPGLGETLRINGKAVIIKDDELLEKMEVKGKRPLLGIAIEVEECFIHCAKAFKRSKLWEMDSWLENGLLPSAAKILSDHAKLPGYNDRVIAESLQAGYKERLY